MIAKFKQKFGREISAASFGRKILNSELAMKFRAQILTRSAAAKFSPRDLKLSSQDLKSQIARFKISTPSLKIPVANFKPLARGFKIFSASFKPPIADFKIPAGDFKTLAARVERAANVAKAARLKILKFNARAANG